MKRWWPVIAVATLLVAVAGAFLATGEHASRPGRDASADGRTSPTLPNAHLAASTFVGSDACRNCHAEQDAAWRTSQHAHAMQSAMPATVLGDFSGATLRYAGRVHTFFRRGTGFFVRTDGADGKLADFEVRYTFGVAPLQQYLVPFPDGRLQALPFAWDSRPRENGGQRWFHLRPGEAVGARDELHWTRANANWNFMCADCHSTDVRRNYDEAKDTFATTWSEISVGCEACHGPASAHVTWAAERRDLLRAGRDGAAVPRVPMDSTRGLTVALTERDDVRWTVDPARGKPVRSRPRETAREIEVCAQCHARRSQIAEGYRAGARFLDHYRPSLLETGLYHPDGQQLDEVFTWGSFQQSRMNHAGVTCSDCHEPHSGRLRAAGNAVCTQCHAAAKYAAERHHHHRESGAFESSRTPSERATRRARGWPPPPDGTQCVDCHMPATTYMVVDARRDHSFRVPRPDLTAALGTPNACNGCHADRDAAWAVAMLQKWNGRQPAGFQRYAAAFAAADRRSAAAPPALLDVAADVTNPTIARASALERLGAWPSPESLTAAQRGLTSSDALERRGAIAALAAVPPAEKFASLAPLLRDPVRAVRLDAVDALAGGLASADDEQRAAFARAADEFDATQRLNASRPEARAALASFRLREGRIDDARALFESALRLDPAYVPGYANLADLERVAGDDAAGEAALRRGLRAVGDQALLRHALGLTLVRMHRLPDALRELAAAARLAPDDARFAYVYAVALDSAGRRDDARRELQRALVRHPDDADLKAALAAYANR